MKNIIVPSTSYKGKYVALESFEKNNVIASGTKPEDVINLAKAKGIECPVIVFVPRTKMTHIY